MAKQANQTNARDIQNEIKTFITSFGINNEEIKQDADLAGKEFQGAFSFINKMSNYNDSPMSFVPEDKKQFVHDIINILTNISNDIKSSTYPQDSFDYDKWNKMSDNISNLSQKLDTFNAETDHNFIGAGEMRLLQKFSDRLSKLDMKIQSRELVEDALNLQNKTKPIENTINVIRNQEKKIADECEKLNIIPNQVQYLQGNTLTISNAANQNVDQLPTKIYKTEEDLFNVTNKNFSVYANLLEDDMWQTRSNQLKLEQLNKKAAPDYEKLTTLLKDKNIPDELKSDINKVLGYEKQESNLNIERRKEQLDEKIQTARSQFPEIVDMFNENKYNFRQIKETRKEIEAGIFRIKYKESIMLNSEQGKKYSDNFKSSFQKMEQIVNSETDQNKISAKRNKLETEMKKHLTGNNDAAQMYDSIRKMKDSYEYSRQVSLDMKKFSDGLIRVDNMNHSLSQQSNILQNDLQRIGRPKELNRTAEVKAKLGKELDEFSKSLGMCKRAGHKDTAEFKALSDALNEAKTNMNEDSFKKLSEAADNYLEKKGTRNPFATKMRLHRIDMAKKISSFAKECGECAKIVNAAEDVTEKSKNALIFGSKVNGKSLVDDVSRNLLSKPGVKEKATERRNIFTEIGKKLSASNIFGPRKENNQKKNNEPSVQGP